MRICPCCADIFLTQHCLNDRQLLCVHACASAAVCNIICAADEIQYLLCQRHTLVRILLGGKAFNQRFQLARFIKCHSVVQRINVADTSDIRQLLDIVGNFNIKLVHRIEQIGGDPQLANAACCAVGAGEACSISDSCFCSCFRIHILIAEVYGGYAKLCKGFHFALAAYAVSVAVHPHAQTAENFVVFIDNAVAVAVILRQRFKAVLCGRSVGEQGLVAEKLTAVVNRAVAVQVKAEKTVLLCPVYLFCKAVFVKVKVCAVFLSFNVISIAVNVED